jgi:phenylalanyl-tRNA synthetase beta chain
MGGLNSEVRAVTNRVLLESANFKGIRIRRTAVRLDLRTESSQRFEKNQPPVNVKLGAGRILKLLEEAGGEPKATSRFTIVGDLKAEFRPLAMTRAVLDSMAGKEIPDEEVVSILHRLGFQARFDAGRLLVGIPPHRSEKDLSMPADIVEEVLRIYGYGRIEPQMPRASIAPLYLEKSLRIEHKARRLLAAGHRFVEVQNYAWTDDRWLTAIGFTPESALELRNPGAQYNRLLRTTLVPNMLSLVRPTRKHRDSFRLFEIGRVYRAADDGAVVEQNRLAGVSFNHGNQPTLEEHFSAVKGALEDLARIVGRELAFQAGKNAQVPWQAPGHWATVLQGGKPVGELGVLGGGFLEKVVEEGQVVWFELALDELDGSIYPQLKYQPPSIYPGSWQDFSLVWDLGKGFAALEQQLNAFSHALVVQREFLGSYKGKGLPPGKGSYSFRYWIGLRERTLTNEDIDDFHRSLLAFLEAQGISLRV